jgi:hypothetical protein
MDEDDDLLAEDREQEEREECLQDVFELLLVGPDRTSLPRLPTHWSPSFLQLSGLA